MHSSRSCGMRRKLARLAAVPILLGVLGMGTARLAVADVVIDFEHLPALPAQPNNFAAAGPMQTYTDPGVFSITGGVVLGNPVGLAAFPAHGSVPNTYGTTDAADPTLLNTITLTMPASEMVVSVSGVFFNGQPINETYQITADSGATPVASQTLTGMPPASSTSDFANFSLTSDEAHPITTVLFNPPSDTAINGWDYFVDTITLTPVPEPSSLLMAVGGLLVLGLHSWRKRTRV